MVPPSSPRPPPPPPPPPPQKDASLSAAADLIRTLDTAFEEMSSLSASAAKDAEDARRNARAASEVARRYTARSFPQIASSMSSPSPPRSFPELLSSPSPSRQQQQQQHNNPSYAPPRSSPRPPASPRGAAPSNNSSSMSSPPMSPMSPTRKRKIPKPPSDRLAQSHAEDVLTLSLELERTKQALERERHEHDTTRMMSSQHRAKSQRLEIQMEKLLAEMEEKREESGRKIDVLEQDLLRSKVRVEAAEEDAQAALDLATESASSRDQLEHWLQSAMEEVTVLREQLATQQEQNGGTTPNKKNHVRFAESPTIVTVPNRDGTLPATPPPPPPPPSPATPSTPSRTMVAAGRNLLAAARSPARSPDKVHQVCLTPQKSAERRQRLRERLRALDEDVIVIATPPKPPPPPPPPGVDMGLAKNALQTCHAVANVLRESATSQKLVGRWVIPPTLHDDVSCVEQLTRRYCGAVESKSKRHLEDISELQALCGYLEEKVALTQNGDKAQNV